MGKETNAKQNMIHLKTKQKFCLAEAYGLQKESAETGNES